MTAATPHRTAATSPCFEVLLTASLVSSLIMPDSNVVAVSLPAIGRSLAAIFIGILVSVAGMGAVVSGPSLRSVGIFARAPGSRRIANKGFFGASGPIPAENVWAHD